MRPTCQNSAASPRDTHAHDIGEELDHIISSPTFRSAPRLAAFLRFVVEMALSGQSDRIKGYTIGVEALGRSENFDPRTDAIVRVEAGRLRRALARYYTGEGADDPLIIELPRGRYVPVFHARTDSPVSPQNSSIAGRDRAGTDATTLFATVQDIYEVQQQQMAVLAAQILAMRTLLAHTHAHLAPSGSEPCRPALPLLPTAPSAMSDAGRPADGRQKQQIQQTQSAPAARPR